MASNAGDSRRPDSKQLIRQWAILRLLADSGRAFSVKELAEQLSTSKATIQRDLATLEHEFALIEESAGKQKKLYKIDQSIGALGAIQFGTSELLALHAAGSSLSHLAGSPIHDDLKAVTDKIRGFLSPRHNGGLDAIARVFLTHTRNYIDYTSCRESIDELGDAIARNLVCKLTYNAAWKDTRRDHVVKPLRLVWHRSCLYLFCNIGDKETISTLAIHRIEDLEATKETFKPGKQDVEGHARKAFGIFVSDDEEEVEIIFSEYIAWRIEERVFHPDEHKERLEDGRLKYTVKSSAQWEIIPWVQSFGALAELTKPASWREEIADTVKAMCKGYDVTCQNA